MKIKKAIIPAAGLGTRVLPASKACPKEMLPIVDKPAIQYIVEEAVKAGITDVLIITNRGKGIIEDHFDHSFELETMLKARGKTEALAQVEPLAHLANIYFIRQKETRGLGDAVLRAKEFVGDEPFAVLYGDDVIIGEIPAIGELCEAYERYGKSVVGIKEVSDEYIVKYSSMKTEHIDGQFYSITDMIEKPSLETKFSNFSILGRCVLEPEIFNILSEIPLGAGGELQLTDAMAVIARTKGITGVDFSGTRYDMGNKFGILKANIEVGLTHPETKDELREYIKEIASKL
ncbi:MAG: UTP--glucose-1-phosphate uridylyltransferase GalU [Oscillospiraceae bacterium]|nr:UTP--glucose-1-phosphate uridylyltransferase GalU [Oscillospiraceae bacterium]